MPRSLYLLPTLLLLAGCPECPECEKCEDCPTATVATDWDQLYTDLAAGGEVAAPTQIADNGNQLFEGETGLILAGPTPVGLGQVFTVKPALATDPWTEVWISTDKQKQVQPAFPLQLKYVKYDTLAEGQLTPTRLAALSAQDTADTNNTYTLMKAVFKYLAFPTDGAINALPNSPPPNVTNATYEVFTIVGSAAPVRSGGLYREIETVNGVERWRDTWVLYDNYLMPYCVSSACDPANNLTVVTELRLVVGAAASPHLKGFLLDAKADKPGPTTAWKYVPIAPYELITPLPATVP